MSVAAPLPPLEAIRDQIASIKPQVSPPVEKHAPPLRYMPIWSPHDKVKGLAQTGAYVQAGEEAEPGPTEALRELVLPILEVELGKGLKSIRTLHISGTDDYRLSYQVMQKIFRRPALPVSSLTGPFPVPCA
jgi:hypothetical protein